MSDKNSKNEFKTKIIENPRNTYKFIMFSTDGYINSFTTKNGFYKAVFDIYSILKNIGIDKIKDNIQSWLSETSELGSGDDISIGFIYFEDRDELQG